jgi:hypothetical protein
VTKLFLDDVREAPDDTWMVVRSFDEFTAWIKRWGVPDVISFDHDLGFAVPTGMDCAKWIVDQGLLLKEFRVHSANPVGKENIEKLLTNWKLHCEAQGQPKGALKPGMRVRIRKDGELGRPISIWLVSVSLYPPEKHMGKEGVLEKPNFDMCIIDGWGAAHLSVVKLDGEDIPRFVPNPALEFLGS